MYYNSRDNAEFLGHRVEQMAVFLTQGWGCIKKDDLFGLFSVPKVQYSHFKRVINATRYAIVETDDCFYHEVYKGYKPSQKYMNSFSVLVSLARKNPRLHVAITTEAKNELFTLIMYLSDENGAIDRTYYIVDTAQIQLPIYVLKSIIQEETQEGFHRKNRLLILVYSEQDIEYFDVNCPLFFVLQRALDNKVKYEFYNNEQLAAEQE